MTHKIEDVSTKVDTLHSGLVALDARINAIGTQMFSSSMILEYLMDKLVDANLITISDEEFVAFATEREKELNEALKAHTQGPAVDLNE